MVKENQRREIGDGTGRTCLCDGSMVGPYETTFLASGGMSVVYKSDLQGQAYVLKEVEINNTRDVPSLMSEKSLLERLDHPGLVSCKELLTHNGYYYLVVEYVAGEPLSQRLESGPPAGVDEVVDWGIQLAEIFDYLHTRQPTIIYRDLKPENILCCEGRLKLIDFGIARLHKGGREQDTALFGSVLTASPEHYGRGETDERSDIYTLGATLYQFLAGDEPGRNGAFNFTPLKELRPEIPADLSDLIESALQVEPEKRPQTAKIFADGLRAIQGGEPVDADTLVLPTKEAAPEPRARKRSPLAMLLVGLVVLLGIAGFVFKPGLSPDAKPYGGTAEGLKETNLSGDIFAGGRVDDKDVVMLGEDVGLFWVTGWREEVAEERAGTLAKRLNGFYHQFCSLCGKSKLEPGDIRVGRYTESKDVVVFYAHTHEDGRIYGGPLLLATVTSSQAEEAGVGRRFLAASWRDLLRDTVQLSRGFAVHQSALGEDLEGALAKARTKLRTGEVSVGNLRKILREVTGEESLGLQKLFLKVPKGTPTPDQFEGIKGYEPLKT